jgi:uncharacterized hydrophobic protein (TIGR00271 family)
MPPAYGGGRQDRRVITVRVTCPSVLTEDVVAVLRSDDAASSLVVLRGAALVPEGDVVEADLPRESVNAAVDALRGLGVPAVGTVQLLPVHTWLSREALEAEEQVPGASADAVVWAEVTQRAYEDSALTWTFLSFMILATLLAAIAVVTDSIILVIGAMVLGPEFVPIAAIGLGLVRRRRHLIRRALGTLAVGFSVAILAVTAMTAVARWSGMVEADDLVLQNRPGTAFIFSPSGWSIIIALIAGAAGVLSLTSAKSTGLAGVFISVTTIPAAGNIAVALVFANWEEVWGSSLTLVLNITGMGLAGWATLAVQQAWWRRVSRGRARR